MKIPKKNQILYTILCLICLVFIGIIIMKSQDSPIPQPTYSVPRHIEYSFTLRNQNDHTTKNIAFWTYAPVAQTATQHCSGLESAFNYQLMVDSQGNQIMQFAFDAVPPYATKIIRISADLLLSDTPNPLNLEDASVYLRPQVYCESDHPEILETAKKLKGSDPLKTAENIFNWVANNVQVAGYIKNAKGALYALKNKKGDCTEFMYLFAALCRASDIPTRCIGGYVCNKNTVLKPTAYHNWAEFYHDGTWWISDPQHKLFKKVPSNYIAMKIIGPSSSESLPQFNRFHVKGDGVSAKMN